MVEYHDGLAVLDQVGTFGYRRLVDVYDNEDRTGIRKIDGLLRTDHDFLVFLTAAYESIYQGLYFAGRIIHDDVSALSENLGDTVDTDGGAE